MSSHCDRLRLCTACTIISPEIVISPTIHFHAASSLIFAQIQQSSALSLYAVRYHEVEVAGRHILHHWSSQQSYTASRAFGLPPPDGTTGEIFDMVMHIEREIWWSIREICACRMVFGSIQSTWWKGITVCLEIGRRELIRS